MPDSMIDKLSAAMPPRPAEKVLLCSKIGLEKLLDHLPDVQVSCEPTVYGIRIVVRQGLPLDFCALVDEAVLAILDLSEQDTERQ